MLKPQILREVLVSAAKKESRDTLAHCWKNMSVKLTNAVFRKLPGASVSAVQIIEP